jgi:hypothetical protein
VCVRERVCVCVIECILRSVSSTLALLSSTPAHRHSQQSKTASIACVSALRAREGEESEREERGGGVGERGGEGWERD